MNVEDEEPKPFPGMYDDNHGQKISGVPFWKRVGTTRFLVFLFGAIAILSFDWPKTTGDNTAGYTLLLPVFIGLAWIAFFSPNYLPGQFILEYHRDGVKDPKKGEFAGFSLKRGFWTLFFTWLLGVGTIFTSTLLSVPIAFVIDWLGYGCLLPANWMLC